MTRGEVWWADFGVPFGSEPGYRRPVLVMQSDVLNEGGLHTIMAIPLTTNLINADSLGNVVISKAQSGLSKDCMTIPFQIYPLDRARFVEQAGEVSEKVMRRVEDGLLQVLNIRR